MQETIRVFPSPPRRITRSTAWRPRSRSKSSSDDNTVSAFSFETGLSTPCRLCREPNNNFQRCIEDRPYLAKVRYFGCDVDMSSMGIDAQKKDYVLTEPFKLDLGRLRVRVRARHAREAEAYAVFKARVQFQMIMAALDAGFCGLGFTEARFDHHAVFAGNRVKRHVFGSSCFRIEDVTDLDRSMSCVIPGGLRAAHAVVMGLAERYEVPLEGGEFPESVVYAAPTRSGDEPTALQDMYTMLYPRYLRVAAHLETTVFPFQKSCNRWIRDAVGE